MDYVFSGVTVPQFRQTMFKAASAVHAVSPAALREPLLLWFKATEERSRIEKWDSLLGRPVITVWNAAHAVLDAAASLQSPDTA